MQRSSFFLCFCSLAMHLLLSAADMPDPETRAQLEAKVISQISLKNLEKLVESDERVMNAPKSRIILIPKPKKSEDLSGDHERDAIIIERKPKKYHKKATAQEKPYAESESPEYRYAEPLTPEYRYAEPLAPEYRYAEPLAPEYRFPESQAPEVRYSEAEFDSGIRRSSFEPRFQFESAFRHEENFPHFFKEDDLESAGSSPVQQFYESIVESVLNKQKFGLDSEPFAALDIAASENIPEYKPRFDYDAYTKDSTETKLQGKPYWKDSPDHREEMLDENGCRTVIKKVVDPEDGKKSSSEKAKSVIITKECEYPNLNGPDAKITEARPLRHENSRFDSQPSSGFTNYDNEPSSYAKDRPDELNLQKSEERDPLASEYIDSMLEKHFKSFPGFNNPLSSFKGYQERFKLRAPEAFKNVKPTVGVHTYEYSHPKSGFDDEAQASVAQDSGSRESPKVYEHHYNYDYPENSPGKPIAREYDDEPKQGSNADDSKEPKMLKKSFAYYRKDNPKSDPDDHQYAEEYAQGNYRSFSSSYDSEKDGEKNKKQQ